MAEGSKGSRFMFLLLLITGQLSGVLGQTLTADQQRLIGVTVGGVLGAVLLILLIVILVFLCRPNRHKHRHTQLMDNSYGSSVTPTGRDKYQHLPPGVWTSNPSLVPVLPQQVGLTRYMSYPTQAPHLQLSPNLHSSRHFYQPTLRRAKSALQRLPAALRAGRSPSYAGLHGYRRFHDVKSISTPDVRYTSSSVPGVVFYNPVAGGQAQIQLKSPTEEQVEMTRRMNISDHLTQHNTQVDGKQTVTARVFSECVPLSDNFIQSAPTISHSNSPPHDGPDLRHKPRHVLTARVYSDVPPGGHQVKRTNSRTVHDYVPSILGGGGLLQQLQQGAPIERGGVTSTQSKNPSSQWSREHQPVPGQLPGGVSHNGGARGIYLRRSLSEAAAYASIPIMTSQVKDNCQNFMVGVASETSMMASNPVCRSHSNVSIVNAPKHHPQTNQVTSYSTSDIYAIPNKIPRHTQKATQPEIQEETSSITIMGAGNAGDSPPPPPLPPITVSNAKDSTLSPGQIHRTLRGTVSLTLGPEDEEDYEAMQEDEKEVNREEAELVEVGEEEGELEGDVHVHQDQKEGRLEAEVLEEQTALPSIVHIESPPGGAEVSGGLKGPDLTRHLPEFDNTDIEEAHSAFRFLDQYSLSRESLSQHSLGRDSSSQQSSLSFSTGRVFMLSTDNFEETVLDFSYLQAKGKHVADEAFRFLDELDDGDEASR